MFFIKWDDCIFRQMFRVIFDKQISNKTILTGSLLLYIKFLLWQELVILTRILSENLYFLKVMRANC